MSSRPIFALDPSMGLKTLRSKQDLSSNAIQDLFSKYETLSLHNTDLRDKLDAATILIEELTAKVEELSTNLSLLITS
jgi:hypothetical protein